MLRLEDARPRLELPISLIGVGATVIAASLPLWVNINRRSSAPAGNIALAVALTVAGIALGGTGTYLTISGRQQRDENDARIEELRSLGLPPAMVHQYWHF